MIVLDIIVLIFSDIIFLTLFGWGINPIYNRIERAFNTAIADSFLLIIELIFYGLVLAGIILLIEKIRKDRRKLRNVTKSEKQAYKAQKKKEKAEGKIAKEKPSKSKVEKTNTQKESKPKREYRDYV